MAHNASEFLTGTLIGLAKACDVGCKTKNTDALIVSALAATGDDLSREEADTLISRVLAEKALVSPGCSSCTSPCGNTSTYDMSLIMQAEPEVRDAKLEILQGIRVIASMAPVDRETVEFLRTCLCVLSEDLPVRFLHPTLKQRRKLQNP